MAVISIKNLDEENYNDLPYEVSFLEDLTENEFNLTHGGFFPVVVIGAAWLGYRIAKEIKTHLY